MTVKQLQALAPKSEVYELRSDARYVLSVDPNYVSQHMVEQLHHALTAAGVPGVVVLCGSGIKFFELEPTEGQ